jgi:hypothetical protein
MVTSPHSRPSATPCPPGEPNLRTSLEFIGNSAYIVNLLGEVWVIEDVSPPPFGLAE